MPAPIISEVPIPPSRQDPVNFPARADTFLAHFPTLQTELNNFIGYLNTNTIINYEFADGTNLLPAFTFQSDPNTGFYRVSEGTVGFTSNGTLKVTLNSSGVTIADDLAVNGGDITSTSSTASIFNSAVNNLSIAGSASAVRLGGTTGTLTLGNPEIVGTQSTQNLFNSVSTTINFGAAATAINLGAATGTFTVNNASTSVKALTSSGKITANSLEVTNAATLDGVGNKLTVSGTGSTLVVSPEATGSIDNAVIGATVQRAGSFTTVTATRYAGIAGGSF